MLSANKSLDAEQTPTEQVSVQRRAIQEVQQICEARIVYNQALIAFLKNSNDADKIGFLKKNLLARDKYSQETIESLASNHELMKYAYSNFIRACAMDCIRYQKAINLIRESQDNQKLIDRLFLTFKIEYEATLRADNITRDETKKKENQYELDLESIFIRTILNILENKESRLATGFFDCHDIQLKDVGIHGSLVVYCSKEKKLNQMHDAFSRHYLDKYLIEALNEFPELSPLSALFESIGLDKLSMIRSLGNTSIDPMEYFENFKQVYEIYLSLKELNKVREQCQQFINESKDEKERLVSIETKKREEASKKKASAKKHTQRKKATDTDTAIETHALESSSSNVEIILKTPSIVAESQPTVPVIKPLSTPTLSSAQEKALAYKQSVLEERAEKEAEKLALKRSQIEQRLQAARDQQARERGGEALLQTIAFQRLYGLNNQNLDRLECILSRTDSSMRYADIQALIGKASYQLQGSLENVNAGSHRKVTLDAVPDAPNFLGYFDEPTLEEAQNIPPPGEAVQDSPITPILFSTTANASITGGIYRGHGAVHSAKLTPIIKMMLSDIFSKAGITKERLTLFREVKASCEARGIEQPTVAELQAALAIERDRVEVKP